jgi:hypothetical protein
MTMTGLLDPTNDYVFKRLFAEAPGSAGKPDQ